MSMSSYASGFRNKFSEFTGLTSRIIYEFVTPKPVDPNEEVTHRGTPLNGRAKELKIQLMALQNNRDRWDRVTMVGIFVLGNFMYHKGLWDHNLVMWGSTFPVVGFCIYAKEKFRAQLNDKMDQLIQKIELAIQDGPLEAEKGQ